MSNKQLCILRKRRIKCRKFFQSACKLIRFRPHKHQSSEDSRRYRVPAQLQQFAVAVGVLLFHGPLEHCGAARVLVLEFGGEFLHIVKGLVFLEGGGNGLDGFVFFEEFQF